MAKKLVVTEKTNISYLPNKAQSVTITNAGRANIFVTIEMPKGSNSTTKVIKPGKNHTFQLTDNTGGVKEISAERVVIGTIAKRALYQISWTEAKQK